MRHFIPALIVAVLLLAGAPAAADDPIDNLIFGRFADYVESLRIQAGIPGMTAAIVGRDTILWEHAFGYQDVERLAPARTDTPFHLDGLTEVFTASLLLECAEDGQLTLDDRVGQYVPNSRDASLTIGQVLTHTSGTPDALVYEHHPERLESLSPVVKICAGDSYRETLGNLLDRLAMVDSVPGPDAPTLKPPAQGVPSPAAAARYAGVIERMAQPYNVDSQKRASRSQYSSTTLTPVAGLVSTVLDFARFDLALKKGVLLRPETLGSAWRAPVGRGGRTLPHGAGWFVQGYNGQTVVWQFGAGDSSSSMAVTLPGPGLTLILLANSNGLVKTFPLAAGDLTVSPFARVFLGLFVR